MRTILSLIFATFICQISFSQYSYNTAFFQNSGNPGGLNAENDNLTGGWTIIMPGTQSNNIWTPVTTIPFPFYFYGSPVTSFKASQNGVVTFNTATVTLPGANENLPSLNLPDSSICFWDDFTASPPTGPNDQIHTKTFGSAPNRQFWIRWFSFEMGNPTSSFSYFSVILEETTNKIYVIDQYSINTPLSLTVGVQLNNTTAVQFGNDNISTVANLSVNSDNDYWEFAPVLLVNDNAGVISVDNPVNPITAGMQNVDVTIENFGVNILSSATVEWEVNGQAQTAVPFAGSLGTNITTPLNLGMFNFPVGLSKLKAWTSNPNGNSDNDPSNDTLEVALCTPLAGIYTLGGTNPDFTTFAEATSVLETCGVNGPVTINIAPGTYTGGMIIGSINGASAVNTITFDGGDTSLVTITHTGSAPNAVFLLDEADYFTFTNMTIENTGNVDAWGFRLANGADWNTISNNRFLMSMTATSDVSGVAATNSPTSALSAGTNASHTRVLNNHFLGGDDAVRFYGTSDITLNSDNQTIGNTISMAYDYGIYYNDQDSALISGNLISDMRNNSGGDGIYAADIMNFSIMGNTVYVPDWGIHVADGNFDLTPVDRGKIINNMVKSNGDYGIYLDDFEDTDIFHNTSFGKPGIRINDFTGLDIRNNIFVGQQNDYAFETDETAGGEIVDYNLYYVVPGNSVFIKDGPAVYTNLVSWKAGQMTLNVNSLEGNPFFVDPNTDLHVIGNLANDVGDNSVGVGFDIDGEIRPQAPSTIVDIGADEFTPATKNAALKDLLTPLIDCGDSTTTLSIIITNQGTDTITTIGVFGNISGSSTATLAGSVGTNIGFGESDTISLGNINTYNGGTYDLELYISLVGDEDNSNDTAYFTLNRFASTPPVGVAEPVCVGDATYLLGTGDGSLLGWYDSLTDGNLLAIGDTFWTPVLTGNTSYFVGYADFQDSLTTTFAAGNGCGGGNMFDVQANNSIQINGFSINPTSNSGSTDSLSIWYIANSTYSGNQANQAAWTFHEGVSFTSNGNGNIVFVGLNNSFKIPAGSTYAIYVEYNANYSSLSGVYSNSDLTITTGAGLCSSFAGVNAGRTFNGTVHYQIDICTEERTEVFVPVDTAAQAGFAASSLEFVATFTDQSIGNPDSVFYDFGDGNFSSDPNPMYTYADTGTYTVCQIAYSPCSPDTFCQDVTITCTPSEAGFDFSVVELVVTFADSSLEADSVLYDFGDGNTSSVANAVHTYTLPGTFTVCQIAYNDCENDTICMDVMVTCPASQAAFSVTSVELTATFSDSSSAADSVLYDFGDGTTSTDTNPVYTYAAADLYTVCQTTYSICGNDTTCQEIVITCTEPEASFAVTNFNGLEISFADSSANADSVLYDFGDGNTSTNAEPVHTYAASGIYTVCQIAYNLCTPDTTCIEVSVIATGIYNIPGLSTLNIYPNPNNGVFQIEVGGDFRYDFTFEVLTIRGKELFKRYFGTINGTIREGINLEQLSKGVYFMRFTLAGKSVTRKLVID